MVDFCYLVITAGAGPILMAGDAHENDAAMNNSI
jgi:hypothetical protein